jgi:hypothetical protein
MGLDVELPNPDSEDPIYRVQVCRRDWRRAAIGKIDMTAEEISRADPDWLRLMRFGHTAAAWFDLEEGIVFKCHVAEITLVASTIRLLARRCGLPITSQSWSSPVVASQVLLGSGIPSPKDLAPYMEPAGFRGGGTIGRWCLVDE